MRLRLLAFIPVIFTSTCCFADSPAKTVEKLFDAMRAHDGTAFVAQFTPGAILHRAQPDGEIKQSEIEPFAQFIEQSDKHLDEQLLSVTVLQSGNLATVWTPYVFYLNEQLSHCGVNSFQLVKQGETWKIQYLIDNTFGGDCQDFITQHSE